MYFDIKCFQYFQFISHSFVCIGEHSRKYTCLKFLYIVFLRSFHYFLHSYSHSVVQCSTINLIPLEDSVNHSTKFFLHAWKPKQCLI